MGSLRALVLDSLSFTIQPPLHLGHDSLLNVYHVTTPFISAVLHKADGAVGRCIGEHTV
jgi:hypothetical protein